MPKLIDLLGRTFGRLTVSDRAANSKHGNARWVCSCECGAICIVNSRSLTCGLTRSCGCLKQERAAVTKTKHGHCRYRQSTQAYRAWVNMRSRCLNPNSTRAHRYNARGISCQPDWALFENFLRDMGEPPQGFSLDRIDNDGNYTRSNCRWADLPQQANNRSSNHRITINGTTMTIAEWGRASGIPAHTLYNRVYRGWPPEDLLLPAGARRGRRCIISP